MHVLKKWEHVNHSIVHFTPTYVSFVVHIGNLSRFHTLFQAVCTTCSAAKMSDKWIKKNDILDVRVTECRFCTWFPPRWSCCCLWDGHISTHRDWLAPKTVPSLDKKRLLHQFKLYQVSLNRSKLIYINMVSEFCWAHAPEACCPTVTYHSWNYVCTAAWQRYRHK